MDQENTNLMSDALATMSEDTSLAANDIQGVPAYLSFVWAKTSNDELKQEIRDAGGVIPTFVLHRAGNRSPVKPFRFHLFDLRTIATMNDQTGKIVDAAVKVPAGLSKDEQKRWGEHSFAVVGVIQGETIVPASVNLRAGSRRALLYADTATKDSGRPNWAGKGEAYARTVEGTQYLAARVVSQGTIRPQQSETSGHMMLVGQCTWKPASVEEMERFNEHARDPQFVADLTATFRVHKAKLKNLLSQEMEEAGDE